MALQHNPRVITDGLILYYDFANPKSFAGEGTTNQISNQGNFNVSGSGVTTTYDAATKIWKVTVPGTSTGNWRGIYYNKTDAVSAPGDKCSYSFEVKSAGPYTVPFYIDINNWGLTTNAGNDNDQNRMFYMQDAVNYEWRKCYATYEFASSKTENFYKANTIIMANGHNPGYDKTFYIRNIQEEVKANPTPFVDGSRSNFGGAKDLSGFGNHGTFYNVQGGSGYICNAGGVSNTMYIAIPDSASLASAFTQTVGGWTIEEIIWTNSTTYPECDAGSVVSDYGYSAGKIGFDWNHGVGVGTFKFEQAYGSQTDWDTPSLPIPAKFQTLNAWRVRTMVWDRSQNKNFLYINGELVGSVDTPLTAGKVIYDGGGISLGSLYGWKHFGRRAGLKIYNRVLSAAEVQKNFAAGRGRFGL